MAATPFRPDQHTMGAITLLVHCVQLSTGHLDLSLSQLPFPFYEGTMACLCIADGEIRSELPDVPPERYATLKRAEESQSRL